MHFNAFLAGVVLAAAPFAAADAPTATDAGAGMTHSPGMNHRKNGAWASYMATADPVKVATLKSDLHSLHSSMHANPMFTSMKAVMATAAPSSWSEFARTNPQSAHQMLKSNPPDWYKSVPADVKSFMSENRKAEKSVFSKDLGPLPTGVREDGKHGDKGDKGDKGGPSTTAKAGQNQAQPAGQKSEAGSVAVAASAAFLGALGMAMLMM